MSFKNIIHITHTDPIYDSRILNIANSIADLNGDYVQYIIGLNKKKSYLKENYNNKKVSLVAIKPLSKFFLNTFVRKLISFLEFNLRFILKCFLLKPKIIHCHDLSGLYIAIIFKILFRTRFIFDAHELESQDSFVSPKEQVLRTIYEYLPIITCDYLITVSDSIAHCYKWKGAKKVAVIFNKPESPKITLGSGNSLLKKIPPKKNGINLIYIGALEENRSIEKLINIFRFKDGYNLYFLGEGSLENKITKISNPKSNIYLHPFVHKDYIVEFIKGFDYSLCLIETNSLSDYFCMPNKLFQSLAGGIPVIASNIPDLSSYIIKNKVGIIVNDVNEIIERISNLSKKIDFIKGNIKNKESEFLWSSEYEKLNKIYEYLENS